MVDKWMWICRDCHITGRGQIITMETETTIHSKGTGHSYYLFRMAILDDLFLVHLPASKNS